MAKSNYLHLNKPSKEKDGTKKPVHRIFTDILNTYKDLMINTHEKIGYIFTI